MCQNMSYLEGDKVSVQAIPISFKENREIIRGLINNKIASKSTKFMPNGRRKVHFESLKRFVLVV